jgi:hypothetical protein
VRPVRRDEVDRFNAELEEHHWLGHRILGETMRYVATERDRWVALLGFGSPALVCAPLRPLWIRVVSYHLAAARHKFKARPHGPNPWQHRATNGSLGDDPRSGGPAPTRSLAADSSWSSHH